MSLYTFFQNGHAVSLKSQKLKYGFPNGFAEERWI